MTTSVALGSAPFGITPLAKDLAQAMLGLSLAESLSKSRILGRALSQVHDVSVAQRFTAATFPPAGDNEDLRSRGISTATRISRRTFSSAGSSRALRAPGIRGVHPVIVTPFHDDESLDLVSYRHLIRRVAQAGCRGVTILGVMGESNRLVDSERERLIEAAVDVAGEIQGGFGDGDGDDGNGAKRGSFFQVCVGTSHTGTEATVQLCQMASRVGADSVMVSPTIQGADEASVLHLYRRIHDVCPDLPIVVQDHPSSTGVHVPANLLGEIVESVPTVACIKLESLPTLDRLSVLCRLSSNNNAFRSTGCSILTGLGALYSGFDLAAGGTDGFMTGFAFPEVLVAMHEIMSRKVVGGVNDDDDDDRSGAVDRMLAVYAHFLPLLVLEQQPGVGLALRKEIYRQRSWISASRVRHPGPAHLSPVMRRELDRHLQRAFRHVDITQPIPSNAILELSGVQGC
jgi:4-hydroxy-tetrahydrodipicolinate synthase